MRKRVIQQVTGTVEMVPSKRARKIDQCMAAQPSAAMQSVQLSPLTKNTPCVSGTDI